MEADILPKNCRPVSAIISGLTPKPTSKDIYFNIENLVLWASSEMTDFTIIECKG
jgi:hypothetical protein